MFIFRFSKFVFDKRIFVCIISMMLFSLNIMANFDISAPIFILFWIMIGNLIIRISFCKDDITNSKRIFYITFFIYLGYMTLTELLYVSDPFLSFFYVPDQMSFYERIVMHSQNKGYQGPGLLDLSNINVMNHGTGLYYLGWCIGRISYAIGGVNSLFIHKLVVVWCVSMTNVFLYNTSRYFFDKNKSKIISLTYGLFSYSLLFSALLLRDLHVALLIAIGFYIALGSFKLKKLIVLGLLAVITFIFRPTHGVYYLFIILLYVYTPLIKYKGLVVMFSIIVLILFIGFTIGSEFGDNLIDRSQVYNEFHEEKASEAGGAAKLYGALPSFLHPPVRIVQSQINPFSLFSVMVIPEPFVNTGQSQYLSYAGSIADFLWFVVWMIIIYGFSKKHIRKAIPNNLLWAFIVAFVLLVLAGLSSFDMRRLLGVYPVIFLTAMVILFNLSMTKRKRVVNIAVIVFITLGIVLKLIF